MIQVSQVTKNINVNTDRRDITLRRIDRTIDVHMVGRRGPQGDQGIQGAQGVQGEIGPGVQAGGTTGQVLKKLSNADFDTAWQDYPQITVSDTPPSSPSVGDIWLEI